MIRYYAHSGTKADKSDWQGLKEHLIAVAELAAEMARPLGLSKAAYIAGLMHDLGKYTSQFQRRLEGGPSADHSTAGAKILLDLPADKDDKAIAELIAYSILGHHAGLPDRLDPTGACFNRRIEALSYEPDIAWQDELDLETRGLFYETIKTHGPHAAFRFSLMARMVFSCLVDAGAWIETISSLTRAAEWDVAPHAGAWIETRKSQPERTPPRSHSSRRSVD